MKIQVNKQPNLAAPSLETTGEPVSDQTNFLAMPNSESARRGSRKPTAPHHEDENSFRKFIASRLPKRKAPESLLLKIRSSIQNKQK